MKILAMCLIVCCFGLPLATARGDGNFIDYTELQTIVTVRKPILGWAREAAHINLAKVTRERKRAWIAIKMLSTEPGPGAVPVTFAKTKSGGYGNVPLPNPALKFQIACPLTRAGINIGKSISWTYWCLPPYTTFLSSGISYHGVGLLDESHIDHESLKKLQHHFAFFGLILCRVNPGKHGIAKFRPVYNIPNRWEKDIKPGYQFVLKHIAWFNPHPAARVQRHLQSLLTDSNPLIAIAAYRVLVKEGSFRLAQWRGDLLNPQVHGLRLAAFTFLLLHHFNPLDIRKLGSKAPAPKHWKSRFVPTPKDTQYFQRISEHLAGAAKTADDVKQLRRGLYGVNNHWSGNERYPVALALMAAIKARESKSAPPARNLPAKVPDAR